MEVDEVEGGEELSVGAIYPCLEALADSITQNTSFRIKLGEDIEHALIEIFVDSNRTGLCLNSKW